MFWMNIYIHIENIIRELDGKLLLATLAAIRGHEVIISDLESIEKGIKRNLLPPGIFHTKSLTPKKTKIERHKFLIKKNNLVTSIDEEGGLVKNNYDNFAKQRYSIETINDASAVFCWGEDDFRSLNKIHSKNSFKIYKTGSPRVDLWRNNFAEYWKKSTNKNLRPYLLVVSNFTSANFAEPFKNRIKSSKKNEAFEIEPKRFLRSFLTASDQFRTIASFIDAIQYISENNKNLDIILRPHQNEDVDSWKTYLEGVPNVYVIREGSLSKWINNAFAIMHNGCTSAIEAIISKKPVITYIPNKQELFDYDFSNKIGFKIFSKNELLLKVKELLDDFKLNKKFIPDKNSIELVNKKIHIDLKELAAEKIINIWEKLHKANKISSKNCNWILFKLMLKAMKINGICYRFIKNIISRNFKIKKDNYKFPPFNKKEINDKIKRFNQVLHIKEKLKCELLSDRTILIKKI